MEAFFWIRSSLSRLAVRPRGQHGDGGAGTVGIIAGPDSGGIGEWDGVIQIHGFAFGLAAVRIDQDDLRRQSAQKQGVSESGTHIANADYGDARGTCG